VLRFSGYKICPLQTHQPRCYQPQKTRENGAARPPPTAARGSEDSQPEIPRSIEKPAAMALSKNVVDHFLGN
jgi:hypothetical protein